MEAFLVDEARRTIPSTAVHSDGLHQEILDLLPSIALFPGEDERFYEGLKQAFMADLAPGTPYETALAQNLVTLEWEGMRHRQLRDGLLLAEFRDLAMGVFLEGKVRKVWEFDRTEGVVNAAYTLVNPDVAVRKPAEDLLAEYHITPSEILAKAYSGVGKSLDPHERKLADIEIRRRRLREDFDRLKAARTMPVEEAQLIENA